MQRNVPNQDKELMADIRQFTDDLLAIKKQLIKLTAQAKQLKCK